MVLIQVEIFNTTLPLQQENEVTIGLLKQSSGGTAAVASAPVMLSPSSTASTQAPLLDPSPVLHTIHDQPPQFYTLVSVREDPPVLGPQLGAISNTNPPDLQISTTSGLLKQSSGVAAAVASAPVILSPSSTASTGAPLLDPSPVLHAILIQLPKSCILVSVMEDPPVLRPQLEASSNTTPPVVQISTTTGLLKQSSGGTAAVASSVMMLSSSSTASTEAPLVDPSPLPSVLRSFLNQFSESWFKVSVREDPLVVGPQLEAFSNTTPPNHQQSKANHDPVPHTTTPPKQQQSKANHGLVQRSTTTPLQQESKANHGPIPNTTTPSLQHQSKANHGLVQRSTTTPLQQESKANNGLIPHTTTPPNQQESKANNGLVQRSTTTPLQQESKANNGLIPHTTTPPNQQESKAPNGFVPHTTTPSFQHQSKANHGLVQRSTTTSLQQESKANHGPIPLTTTPSLQQESKANNGPIPHTTTPPNQQESKAPNGSVPHTTTPSFQHQSKANHGLVQRSTTTPLQQESKANHGPIPHTTTPPNQQESKANNGIVQRSTTTPLQQSSTTTGLFGQGLDGAVAVASAPVMLSQASTASSEVNVREAKENEAPLLYPIPLPAVLHSILKEVPQDWMPVSLEEDSLKLRPKLEKIFSIIQGSDLSGGKAFIVFSYFKDLLDEDSREACCSRFSNLHQLSNDAEMDSDKVIDKLLKMFYYKGRDAFKQIMNPTVGDNENIKIALERLYSLTLNYDISDPATAVARLLSLLLCKPEFSLFRNFQGSDDYSGLLKGAIGLCNYHLNNGNKLPNFIGVYNYNSTEAGQLSLDLAFCKRKSHKQSKRISNLCKDSQPNDSNVPLNGTKLKTLREEQQEQQLTVLCNLLPPNWLLIDTRLHDEVLKHQVEIVFQTLATILPPDAPITEYIEMLRKVSSDEFSMLLHCCLPKQLPSLNSLSTSEDIKASELINAIKELSTNKESLPSVELEYPRPKKGESTVEFLHRLWVLKKVSADRFLKLLHCWNNKQLPSLINPDFPSTPEVIEAIMKVKASDDYRELTELEYPRPREDESIVEFLERLKFAAKARDWKVPNATSRNLICLLAGNSNQFSSFLFLEHLYTDYQAVLNKAIAVAQKCANGGYPITLGTDDKWSGRKLKN